jgi:hypothetical protein
VLALVQKLALESMSAMEPEKERMAHV